MITSNYRVGDKIVEFGQVFNIFQIKNQETTDGKFEKVVFFKPYFKINNASNIICSIPLNNIEKTEIRKPITTKELKVLFKRLKKANSNNFVLTIIKAKELLKSNNPLTMIKLLRILYKEKKTQPDSFSKSKKDVFDSAMDKLVQEFALVSRITPDKAREKITFALSS